MRLVTWNCCGGFLAKEPLLDKLTPDIAVIQECLRPKTETGQRLWFGGSKGKGLCVLANKAYRISALPQAPDAPQYVVPVEIRGPTNFVLIAVWAKVSSRYVRGVVRAVELYRDLFQQNDTVVIGDINANKIWDKEHPAGQNYSALVEKLSDLGLISSYHSYHGEAHGEETQATYYHSWKEQKPFHLDYCFIPKAWAKRMSRVDVGTYAEWRESSDHRPLLVELSEKQERLIPSVDV